MSESLRVQFDIAGGDLRPRYINGMELPQWQQGPTMVEYLSQISEQGWRMTTHLGGQEYLFQTLNAYHQRGARKDRLVDRILAVRHGTDSAATREE